MNNELERVELLRTSEPMRAEVIRDLLEQEGIAASTPGLQHRAVVGPLGGFVEIVVQVPARDRQRAVELVTALDAPPIGPDLRDEVDEEEHLAGYREPAQQRAAASTSDKRAMLAACFAFVLPGGGHLYAGQWQTAAIVALVEILAIVLHHGWGVPLIGLFGVAGLASDVAGATWHCRRLAAEAEGERLPIGLRSHAPLIVAVLMVIWVATMFALAR